MKIFLILALTIYSISAATLSRELVAAKWESFKKTYNREYVIEEDDFRREIFEKNLEHFEEHNEKYRQGLVTYTIGVNQFADMTEDEKAPYFNGLIKPTEMPKGQIAIKSRRDLGIKEDADFPASFDWRDRGIVTSVKNQGGCGACWAFAAAGAIEAQEALLHGVYLDTSEQQLVDCVEAALGCGGGWMSDAYMYVGGYGIDSENAYPYEAINTSCRYRSDQIVSRVSAYAYLTGPDENMLADMVANKGPVSIAFDASGDFGAYSGGVYYNPKCDPNNFTHAVLIVGYGNENGQDYWLIKNSWGDWWGQNGYIKMARNRGNNCGVASAASYPVL